MHKHVHKHERRYMQHSNMCAPTEICLCTRTHTNTYSYTQITSHKEKLRPMYMISLMNSTKKKFKDNNTNNSETLPTCLLSPNQQGKHFPTYSLEPLSSDMKAKSIPRKLHINISYKYKYKFLQQNTGKPNPITYKNEYTP